MRALELSPSANENIDSSIKGPEESNHNPVPEMHEEELKEMLPILGSAFWQSMKNKVRKSRKPSESGHPASMKKTWDLPTLLEQEPRMWSACFRTPESFVKIANCVASVHGVEPVNVDIIDRENGVLGSKFVPLPILKPAGTVTLVNDRIYISSMDLCRYYWRNKSDGTYDRQMQSWNAGRRAALREKTKSYVHIDETHLIEPEWWDVEGILTSTKVLRKFFVTPEGSRALSDLARYVYQRRDFYEESPSLPPSPKESIFMVETDPSLSPRDIPTSRKRTPSMKADAGNPRSPSSARKKSKYLRSLSAPISPVSPLVPSAVSPIARVDWNFHAPGFYSAFGPYPVSSAWAPSSHGPYFDHSHAYSGMYQQRSAGGIAVRQPSFDGSSSESSITTEESAISASSSSAQSGLMLLVDAAAARESSDVDYRHQGAHCESRSSRSLSTDSRSTDSRSSPLEDKAVTNLRPSLSLSAGDKLRRQGGLSVGTSAFVSLDPLPTTGAWHK